MTLASAAQEKNTRIVVERMHNQKQFFVRFWPKTYTLLKLYSKIDVITNKVNLHLFLLIFLNEKK